MSTHSTPPRSDADGLRAELERLAEAAGALATARAKTEAWDEQDRKDKEWETGDARA